MQIAGVAMPPMTSNKFEKYCAGIVKALEDEKVCGAAFQDARQLLDAVLGGDYNRDRAKDGSLLAACEKLCHA